MEQEHTIESGLENRESDVEQIEIQRDDIERRQAELDHALAMLEKDEDLLQGLKKNEANLEADKETLEIKRSDAVQQLELLKAELDKLAETSDQSQEVLEMLEATGEDVTEGNSILQNRRTWLEECCRRIAELAERLGERYDAMGKLSSSEQSLGEKQKNFIKEASTPPFYQQQQIEDSTFSVDDLDTKPDNPVEAYKNYMAAHNYGKDDFEIYSKDLEWRRLVHAAYPDYKLPIPNRENAKQMLRDYMNQHNYGKEDFKFYSKDPEWQYLEFLAYPENITPISIWVSQINPNFNNPNLPISMQKKYQENCGSCAFAMEQHFNGVDLTMVASEHNIGTDGAMEAATGKRCVYMDPTEIERILVKKGAGAHLIVGIDRYNPITKGPATGHWFNLYYDGKKIHTVDGQSGKLYGWPHNYGNISRWCTMI